MTKDEQIKSLRAEVKALKADVSELTAVNGIQRENMEFFQKRATAEEQAHRQTQQNYDKVMAAYITIRDNVGNVAVMLNAAGLNPNIRVQPDLNDNFKGPR